MVDCAAATMVAPASRITSTTVVIAGAVLAGGHESLRFVRPQDEQIVISAFSLGFIEPAQGVFVEKQFQKRVDVAAFSLEFLRHGDADDFTLVNFAEIKGVVFGAKHLGDFGREKVLQIIADGFPHTAKLFIRLVEKAVYEVLMNRQRGAGWSADSPDFPILPQPAACRMSNSKTSGQRDGLLQFKKQFERVGNMRLRLAFEKSFVAALAETLGSIHNEFGIGHKRDAAVAGQIETMRRRPVRDARSSGRICKMNQIMLASIMLRHRRKRFPIHPFSSMHSPPQFGSF